MPRIKHYGRLAVWLIVLPFWFLYYTVSFTVQGAVDGLDASLRSWLRGWCYLRGTE